MKNKRLLGISLILCIILTTIMPSLVLAVGTAESATIKYYPQASYRYDIQGKVNGTWRSTTFMDRGYETYLQVGANEKVLYDHADQTGAGAIMTEDGVELSINLSFINDEKYVRVVYTVKNTNATSRTINLGTMADVQIGGNDDATIERYADSKGLKLYDPAENLQFSFFGKYTAGITTPIDNLWIGEYYSGEFSNKSCIFMNNTTSRLEEKDSAFAYSWTNKTIAAGETKVFSTIIGMGEVSNVPIITPLSSETEIFEATDVQLKAFIQDIDANDEATIHYIVDNGIEKTLPTKVTEISTAKEFTIDLTPENLTAGTHNISVWAIDKQGNPSEIAVIPIIISRLKRPVIVMSEDWSKEDVTFKITDTLNTPTDISKYQYRLGTGAWVDASLDTDYTALSTSGTINIEVRAIGTAAGEVSGIATKTAKVDKQASTIEISETDSKVVVNITEAHSGVQKTEYAWSIDNTTTPTEWSNYTSSIQYTGTEKGTLYLFIKSIDNVGNETTTNKEYKPVEAPVINTENNFVDKFASYKLTDSKNTTNNVGKYEVKINNGNFATVPLNSNIEITTISSGKVKITARTVDVLGRVSAEASKEVSVDNTTAPGILPQTGLSTGIFMLITTLLIVAVAFYKKSRLAE